MKEIALHILDIAENSINAGADRVLISVMDEDSTGFQSIRIEDNGSGMNEEEACRVSDPFYTSRTTRRVGMGIPLFCQHAEMAGGGLKIHSENGVGTTVEARFQLDHPDRQPLGDLEGSWILLVSSNPGIEWELKCETGNGIFCISTSQIRRELDLEFIQGGALKNDLKRMIRNNLDELGLK